MSVPSRVTAAALALAVVAPPAASAAQRQLLETKRFEAPAGKKLVIDAATLNVGLRAADVREIAVTTELRISGVGEDKAERWIVGHTPTFADSPERLTATAAPGRQGFLGLGMLTARARLRLVAPSRVAPDLTTTSGSIRVHGDFPHADPLLLRSATGDIELEGAAASLDIRTASGNSRIELMRPLERLFARTAAGDVTLSGGARTVHVDTASGKVWLDNLSGPAVVETSSGPITLRFDRLDAGVEVSVRSTSGRVTIVLPPDVNPGGTLTTTGGRIRSDFPGVVNEAGDTVTLQGAGPTLTVETASGELIVTSSD